MNPIVGKIKIDFDITSSSPRNIRVEDNSDWIYSEELPAYFQILTPGASKPINYTFFKHQINTLNSHNLGLSCLSGNCTEEQYVDLPDGIYTITLKSGYQGIEETKFYLKTDAFKLEFAKTYIAKLSLSYNEENKAFIEKFAFINGMLLGAKSHTMDGNFTKAQRFFEEAKKLLKKHIECRECI
jgi:hypothetical protein